MHCYGSYLCQRCQQVIIGEDALIDVTLGYGIPQGSVLGPELYSLYTRPLGNIIRHHQLDVQFYANDTQLYVSLMNSDHEERIAAVTRLNDCIRDVLIWLTRNMLKLNDEKTEVILFTSKHGLMKAAATLWNSLPVNIRSSDSCIKFQRQLKIFLFQQQYIDNKSTYQPF